LALTWTGPSDWIVDRSLELGLVTAWRPPGCRCV